MGLYGYAFADLIQHSYDIQIDHSPQIKIGPETSTRSIISITSRKDGQRYIDSVTKSETYKSLEQAASSTTLAVGLKGRKLLKISPIVPAIIGLWNIDSETTSLAAFRQNTLDAARNLGLPAGIITEEFTTSFYGGLKTELSPVAAVVGGVVAQDILNVLSKKEQPIQNLFTFNGNTSEGPIYVL